MCSIKLLDGISDYLCTWDLPIFIVLKVGHLRHTHKHAPPPPPPPHPTPKQLLPKKEKTNKKPNKQSQPKT